MLLVPPVQAQDASGRLADYMEGADLSGSVIVSKNGVTLLSEGYGYANLELGVPNTPQTKLRIGSITKQFTSMAILILQERQRLGVHDSVGKHVPNVPDVWRSLTIHQLLTHTSGIMHSWNLPGFRETMMVPATLDQTLARYHRQPLLFTPGEQFAYSGVGYFLLAKIIETVSGHDYETFLKREIFAPLGMEDTGADRPELVQGQRAAGYVHGEDGEILNAPPIYMPILTGGGNLYSTAEDLGRWAESLGVRRLISNTAYEAMYRPELNDYAYGWRVVDWKGARTIQHSGGVNGFNAHILRIPDEGLYVVVLSNMLPGKARAVAQRLAGLARATR